MVLLPTILRSGKQQFTPLQIVLKALGAKPVPKLTQMIRVGGEGEGGEEKAGEKEMVARG